jgi:hypothetical protein
MNTTFRFWLVSVVVLGLVLVAACATLPAKQQSSAAQANTNATAAADTATPTVDTEATQNAGQTAEALEKANAEATKSAQGTQAVQASATARQNAEATIKAASKATYDANFYGTQTAKASERLAETASAQASATAQVEGFNAVIDQLMADNVITTKEGDYHHLEDFYQSWAQLGWYRWWPTDYSAENFVLSANTYWQSASNTADWYTSGCGIVYSLDDKDDHHLAFLSLDGYGVLGRMTKGDWKYLAAQKYGKISVPDGEAKIRLVVFDKRIYFYVNDQLVSKAYDSSLNEGNIALTLLSGTNKDFGTRCKMTNIELYTFK